MEQVDDEAIRSLLTRLGRRDPSGGTVIERAALMPVQHAEKRARDTAPAFATAAS